MGATVLIDAVFNLNMYVRVAFVFEALPVKNQDI